jgi:hypothetical protein
LKLLSGGLRQRRIRPAGSSGTGHGAIYPRWMAWAVNGQPRLRSGIKINVHRAASYEGSGLTAFGNVGNNQCQTCTPLYSS